MRIMASMLRGGERLSVAMAGAFLVCASSARAATIDVGPIAGSLYLDSHLLDYRWDTSPRSLWGVSGTTKLGPFGTGVRVWRATTSQDSGIPGESIVPAVKMTVTEAIGEYRVVQLRSMRVVSSASIGRLHLGYTPDQVTFGGGGAGGDIEVDFRPIDEWIMGAGLTLRHRLFGGFDAGVGVDRRWFRLDTAHRAGDDIVNERETFGNWTARIELTHQIFRL